MDTLLQLRQNIRKYRKDTGLTQIKAAQIAKMSQLYWGQIERGKRNPSVKTLLIMSEVIGMPMDKAFN